ncbi:MAG: sulfurtransferase TusA family protein [Deinococcales bacterium]
MRGAEGRSLADPPARAGESVRALVDALVEHDFEGVAAVFAPDVDFRALLPREQVATTGAREAAAWFLTWFGDARSVSVRALDAEALGQLTTFRFRLRVEKPRGWSEIAQAGVCEASAGAVTAMRLACTGFQYEAGDEVSPTAASEQRFDAGDLGCGSGLPQAFRERIGAVAVGEVLTVVTRDPSAREDLPALARMLGHRVRSVERGEDGTTMISVERGR